MNLSNKHLIKMDDLFFCFFVFQWYFFGFYVAVHYCLYTVFILI